MLNFQRQWAIKSEPLPAPFIESPWAGYWACSPARELTGECGYSSVGLAMSMWQRWLRSQPSVWTPVGLRWVSIKTAHTLCVLNNGGDLWSVTMSSLPPELSPGMEALCSHLLSQPCGHFMSLFTLASVSHHLPNDAGLPRMSETHRWGPSTDLAESSHNSAAVLCAAFAPSTAIHALMGLRGLELTLLRVNMMIWWSQKHLEYYLIRKDVCIHIYEADLVFLAIPQSRSEDRVPVVLGSASRPLVLSMWRILFLCICLLGIWEISPFEVYLFVIYEVWAMNQVSKDMFNPCLWIIVFFFHFRI